MKNILVAKTYHRKNLKDESNLTEKKSAWEKTLTDSTKCKENFIIGSTILNQNLNKVDLTKKRYHVIMHPMWKICIKCNETEGSRSVTGFSFCMG